MIFFSFNIIFFHFPAMEAKGSQKAVQKSEGLDVRTNLFYVDHAQLSSILILIQIKRNLSLLANPDLPPPRLNPLFLPVGCHVRAGWIFLAALGSLLYPMFCGFISQMGRSRPRLARCFRCSRRRRFAFRGRLTYSRQLAATSECRQTRKTRLVARRWTFMFRLKCCCVEVSQCRSV